jgi:hypothetical protein
VRLPRRLSRMPHFNDFSTIMIIVQSVLTAIIGITCAIIHMCIKDQDV